jgi:hypothetical protein
MKAFYYRGRNIVFKVQRLWQWPRVKQLPSSVVIFSATVDSLPGVILDNKVLLAVQQRAFGMYLRNEMLQGNYI